MSQDILINLDDIYLASLAGSGKQQIWIGQSNPLGMPTLDLDQYTGFHAPASHHGRYDVVWMFEDVLARQGWRILVDSCIRLLGENGTLAIRYTQNDNLSVFSLKSFIGRKYGLEASIAYEYIRYPELLTVFKIRRRHRAAAASKSWTFGILTQGQKVETLERLCRTVRAFGGSEHQILIVGPENSAYEPYGPEYITKTYSAAYAEICRKKNDIVEAAKHDNVCILHDRYWLDDNFFSGFERFGYDFEYVAPSQRHQSGKVYPVYCALGDRGNLVWGPVFHCLDQSQTWIRNYLNGGALIAKRHVFEAIRFNDLLFHHQAEDVELGREIGSRSIVPRENQFSSMQTDAPDSITDVFRTSSHSDLTDAVYPQNAALGPTLIQQEETAKLDTTHKPAKQSWLGKLKRLLSA